MKRILMSALCAVLTVSPLAAGWDEGVAAYKRGNYRAAVNEFTIVVGENPDFAGGHYMLGNSYSALKMYKRALHYLRKAYDLKSTNLDYRLELTWAYYKLQRFDEMYKLGSLIDRHRLTPAQRARYDEMVAAY